MNPTEQSTYGTSGGGGSSGYLVPDKGCCRRGGSCGCGSGVCGKEYRPSQPPPKAPAMTTRPVRVYHTPKREKEGSGYHYPREVLHARALFHQFSIESTELDVGAAHGPVAVVEAPDGTVITPPTHMIQFLDVAQWKPVTGPGQVKHGDRIRFTVGDKKFHGHAKSILNWGEANEEVIYDRGANFYFITSMVANGTSNHKNVEYFDTRGDDAND